MYDLNKWKDLTEFQRNYACYYQKLTQPFISKHWEVLTEWQRDLITQIHKNYPTKTERIKGAKAYA
ncbi:hypothetical protein LCGC14_1894100, partial [marine sediment metagenome]